MLRECLPDQLRRNADPKAPRNQFMKDKTFGPGQLTPITLNRRSLLIFVHPPQ